MRIAEWVDQLADGAADATAGHDDEVSRVRSILDAAADEVRSRVAALDDPPDLPIVLTKSTVMDIHRCLGLAWASSGPRESPDDPRMVIGSALDAYVGRFLVGGEVVDPIGDLESYWEAQGRDESVEALHRLRSGHDPEMSRRLAEQAAGVPDLQFDRQWAPRVEVPMGTLFGGAFGLRGRVDLLLGGPGTGRGAAVIEVKSGAPHPSQHAEVQHYILLAALRHNEMPVGAGVWHPDATFTPIHVAGSAQSAAARVADAVLALVDLWEGRPPRLSPSAHCGWCPAGDVCPRAGDAGFVGGDRDMGGSTR